MWWKVASLVLVLTVSGLKAVCLDGDRICDPLTADTADEVCIPENWWCDKYFLGPDCPNGEDEAFCDASVCQETDRKFCAADDKCINKNWWCDGYDDCSDGEDENCDEAVCQQLGKRYCDNVCILEDYWCDGYIDCWDFEDEIECSASDCKPGTTHCPADEVCLPSWLVDECDGYSDCPSGEDEQNCQSCTNGAFKCPNEDKCIRPAYICDSDPDCEKGEEDYGCDICEDDEFACENGNCVAGTEVCDATKTDDCQDNSDQHGPGCPDCANDERICDPATIGTPDKVCIPDNWWCDGYFDCPEGRDEDNCNQCNGNAFKCPNEDKCIRPSYQCDKDPDCEKGEEDYGCGVCDGSEFECADGSCIAGIDVCDDNDDCGDESDEHGPGCEDEEEEATRSLKSVQVARKNKEKRSHLGSERRPNAGMMRRKASKSSANTKLQALKKAINDKLVKNRKMSARRFLTKKGKIAGNRRSHTEVFANSRKAQKSRDLKSLNNKLMERNRADNRRKDNDKRNNIRQGDTNYAKLEKLLKTTGKRGTDRNRIRQTDTNFAKLERLYKTQGKRGNERNRLGQINRDITELKRLLKSRNHRDRGDNNREAARR